jgi:hypothetical protein
VLMPDKHIKLSESLYGLGGYALGLLSKPATIDDLWSEISSDIREGVYPAQHSFENLVLALDALFAIGAVELKPSGVLSKCDS